MKQILILLLVLIAGLAACTGPDDDDKLGHNIEMESPGISQFGEFEGDWILNNEKIDTAKLIVTEHSFIVRQPSEPLIKYAAKEFIDNPQIVFEKMNNASSFEEINDNNGFDLSDLVVEASNDLYCWFYEPQGYSANKSYNAFSSSSYATQTDFKIIRGTMYYVLKNEKATFGYLSIMTDKPMVAVFDRNTQLWTIRITLNKLSYVIGGDTYETIVDLSSPVDLLFVTTKKVREYKSE